MTPVESAPEPIRHVAVVVGSDFDAVAIGIAEVQRLRKVMIDDVACANNPAVAIGKMQSGQGRQERHETRSANAKGNSAARRGIGFYAAPPEASTSVRGVGAVKRYAEPASSKDDCGGGDKDG